MDETENQEMEEKKARENIEAICEICCKEFESKKQLKQHVKSVHDTRRFACELCDKIFKSKQAVQLHMNVHTGARPYVCSQCRKTFADDSSRRQHEKYQHGDLDISCNQCGKKFRSDRNLKLHLMIHEQQQEIDEDGGGVARFTNEFKLEALQQVQIYGQMETCRRMKISYATLKNWVAACKKNYSCQYCGKNLSSALRREEHERSKHNPNPAKHSRAGKYSVEFKREVGDYALEHGVSATCTKYDMPHSSVRNILKVVTNPHCCPYCSRKCSHQAQLDRHIAEVHMKEVWKGAKDRPRIPPMPSLLDFMEAENIEVEEFSKGFQKKDEPLNPEDIIRYDPKAEEIKKKFEEERKEQIKLEKSPVKSPVKSRKKKLKAKVKVEDDQIKFERNSIEEEDIRKDEFDASLIDPDDPEDENYEFDKHYSDEELEDDTESGVHEKIARSDNKDVLNKVKSMDKADLNDFMEVLKSGNSKFPQVKEDGENEKPNIDNKDIDSEVLNENFETKYEINIDVKEEISDTEVDKKDFVEKLEQIEEEEETGKGNDKSEDDEIDYDDYEYQNDPDFEPTVKTEEAASNAQYKIPKPKNYEMKEFKEQGAKRKRSKRVDLNYGHDFDFDMKLFGIDDSLDLFMIQSDLLDNKEFMKGLYQRKYRGKAKKFQCSFCQKIFRNPSDMRRHMVSHANPNDRPWKCELCPITFNRKTNLQRHHNQYHNENFKPFPCPICGKEFKEKSAMTIHHGRHTGETARRYTCTECGLTFKNKVNLEEHAAEIHEGKNPFNFTCPDCGKMFKSAYNLNIHAKSHMEGGPVCDICGKTLAWRANMEKHRRTHLSPEEGGHVPSPHKAKKRPCEICGKLVNNLKIHMMVHTGEKPYVCSQCGKAYADKVQMRKHIQIIHEGKKDNFSCTLCNKSFTRNTGLIAHMLLHTGPKLFDCQYCGSTYKEKRNRDNHVARQHTDKCDNL